MQSRIGPNARPGADAGQATPKSRRPATTRQKEISKMPPDFVDTAENGGIMRTSGRDSRTRAPARRRTLRKRRKMATRPPLYDVQERQNDRITPPSPQTPRPLATSPRQPEDQPKIKFPISKSPVSLYNPNCPRLVLTRSTTRLTPPASSASTPCACASAPAWRDGRHYFVRKCRTGTSVRATCVKRTLDKATRHKVMSSIRSTGNRSTEIRLRSFLAREGVMGWEVRPSDVIGRPDFAFSSEQVAVFADGCFWHSCPICRIAARGDLAYWRKKLKRNKKRDKLITAKLQADGWLVIRVWEHDIANKPAMAVRRIASAVDRRRRRAGFRQC